jgi:hypothetical protein
MDANTKSLHAKSQEFLCGMNFKQKIVKTIRRC